MDEQCEVEFHIGRYKDKVICDIMSMDVCHILLGMPWQCDRKVVHDGKKNCYKFVKDGIKHTLVPIKEEETTETSGMRVLLMGRKQFLKQVENSEVIYVVVRRAKIVLLHTKVLDFPAEIQQMLHEFSNIVVDDLLDKFPPKRSINHHIDFIPKASLPNKAVYQMSPKDNEEIRKQVQELLDKVLIKCNSNSSRSQERRMANMHRFEGHQQDYHQVQISTTTNRRHDGPPEWSSIFFKD